MNFQMFKLDWKKAEEPDIKLPTLVGSLKKQENSRKQQQQQKKIYFCFIDYPKAFDYVQFSSVTQSCPTLCNAMNHSTPGLPDHHQLLESTQTHIHWVNDAIQPSHPLLSAFPPAPNPSQH